MERDDIFALIAVERRRVADLFEGLDDWQWGTQSLCSGWTVREVAGHLVVPFNVSGARFVLGVLTSGSFHRYSTKVARQQAGRPTAELVATLRDHADDRFVPPGSGPLAPLTDLAVHCRDVARPLALETSASPEAWLAVLGFLVSPRARRGFVPRGRISGLHLAATDQHWESGQGPAVRGTCEALAMAVAGRPSALADLEGDGVVALAAHLD